MLKRILAAEIIILSQTSFSSFALSNDTSLVSPTPHFQARISALNTESNLKPWSIRLQDIAPNENVFFIVNGKIITNSITIDITKNTPFIYGFAYNQGTDFNETYTITAIDTSQAGEAIQHKTKSCVFIVGAKGPADPYVVVENYSGANCSYKNHGVGPKIAIDYYLN